MHVGIVLEGMPKLLQGIVLDMLTRQPDFAVFIIEEGGDENLVEAIGTHLLDVLITVVPHAETATPPIELLYARPCLKVLGLQSNGQSAVLFSLRPETSQIAEVSPNQLVATIRSQASSQTP